MDHEPTMKNSILTYFISFIVLNFNILLHGWLFSTYIHTEELKKKRPGKKWWKPPSVPLYISLFLIQTSDWKRVCHSASAWNLQNNVGFYSFPHSFKEQHISISKHLRKLSFPAQSQTCPMSGLSVTLLCRERRKEGFTILIQRSTLLGYSELILGAERYGKISCTDFLLQFWLNTFWLLHLNQSFQINYPVASTATICYKL